MRRQVVQLVLGATIAAAVGIVLGLTLHFFPTQASSEAGKVHTLWDVLVIVSVPMFVLVASMVVFSVIHFRQRPGQELQDGPPIHGNTKLEVIWTVIPAVLLISLASYSYVVLHNIEKKKPDRIHVAVTARQFAWSYAYKDPASGKTIKTTQLFLPEGRQVEFDLTSLDVIHDFWVPNFSIKSDIVPGITTHYVVTPTRTGIYPVVCAELCGLGHSTMRSTVHVLPREKFQRWVASQTSSGKSAASTGSSPGGTG